MDRETVRAAVQTIAKNSLKRQQANRMAEDTRMGGKFTDKGLELADKNATLNAMDRMKAKELMSIGLGGSLVFGGM